jgi:hypothetical protein
MFGDGHTLTITYSIKQHHFTVYCLPAVTCFRLGTALYPRLRAVLLTSHLGCQSGAVVRYMFETNISAGHL